MLLQRIFAAALLLACAGLALMALLTGAGALVMDRLGRANPWFMGAMLVSMALTMAGISLSAVPAAMVNAAQLVIGVSLGVRFRADFLRTAPRWLVSVAAGTLVLMGACTLFAGLLAWATGLPWVTLLLGTSPGGITEMAITAKVLQLPTPPVIGQAAAPAPAAAPAEAQAARRAPYPARPARSAPVAAPVPPARAHAPTAAPPRPGWTRCVRMRRWPRSSPASSVPRCSTASTWWR